ncbi:MAG: hypothetical protein A3G18_09205 [Rhodospirillales bacterium RIFCSPLOWO2_12_FULL_58_28]|nr:MAG: hypothetical protein A3H92_02425 [Rhodospirillales bacterium RIFCSPLOWO2_02_FULL_58_16]OHC79346.1 MAG: hypothetical protein A3G18_09205 [Rhodospirillales bacterium RIFCSPLOWO2_12_FULL_58_28]
MKIVRLGLIGAGPWGRNYIRTIRKMKGIRLAGLASRNPESRTLVDRDCIISEDWREVIDADDLDGVIIATPPNTHAEIAKAAISAGRPVLIEKPLTVDLREAEELLALCEAVGGLVMVDHIHLFSAAWEALKQEALGLGPIRAIVSLAGKQGPFREKTSVLWDWGPHDIAMCCDLLGRPPEAITATRTETRQLKEGVGETLKLDADFGQGLSAGIVISNLLVTNRRYFCVYFDDCALVYDDTSADKLTRHSLPEGAKGTLGPKEPLTVKNEALLNRVINKFRTAIVTGSRDISGLRLGVTVVDVLTRAQQSCVE